MDDRLPFEFVILGTPRSQQAKRQTVWRKSVQDAAGEHWPEGLLRTATLRVVMVYYYKDGSLDVDNMIKPILDSLKGLIYDDDNIIDEVLARKSGLASGTRISNASPLLMSALATDSEFVYVRIEEGPDHGIIP